MKKMSDDTVITLYSMMFLVGGITGFVGILVIIHSLFESPIYGILSIVSIGIIIGSLGLLGIVYNSNPKQKGRRK